MVRSQAPAVRMMSPTSRVSRARPSGVRGCTPAQRSRGEVGMNANIVASHGEEGSGRLPYGIASAGPAQALGARMVRVADGQIVTRRVGPGGSGLGQGTLDAFVRERGSARRSGRRPGEATPGADRPAARSGHRGDESRATKRVSAQRPTGADR